MRAELLVVDDVTRLAQRRAADPRASAWVSANAGAGKTKVLSDGILTATTQEYARRVPRRAASLLLNRAWVLP